MSKYELAFTYLGELTKDLEDSLISYDQGIRLTVDDFPEDSDECLGILFSVSGRGFVIKVWESGEEIDDIFFDKCRQQLSKAIVDLFGESALKRMKIKRGLLN